MVQRLVLLLVSLLFLSCGGGGSSSGGDESASQEASNGQPGVMTFRVQLPGGIPRGVLAQGLVIDRVVLTITQGEEIIRQASANLSVGQTVVDLSVPSLPPGDYAIQVEGYQGNEVIATDGTSVTLSANTPTTVRLILTFLQPLNVTPQTFNLTVGSTQTLAATRGGVPVTATFTSLAPGTATVNNAGVVTGVAAGAVQIQVTEGGDTVLVTVNVTNAVVLNSITVTPAANNLQVGNTLQFTATGNFSNGTTQNLTNTVTWTSSLPGIATINGTGLATGVAAGGTTITATQGGITGNTTLTVFVAVTLNSITVTPAGPSIGVGGTQQFTATGNFSNGTTQNLTATVTWTSSLPGIATINGTGLATGVAAGATTITATQGAISGTTNLTVTAGVTLVRVDVTPANRVIGPGQNLPYTATAVFSNMTTMDVTNMSAWSSNNTGVATINPTTGVATGVGNGEVQFISAVFMGVTGSTSLEVFGGAILPSAPIATATDTSLIDEDVLPDVAYVNNNVLIVKENSSVSFESHVLMERYLAPLFPLQTTTLTPQGPMFDFGGNGSFQIGSGPLPSRGDREPTVALILDGVVQAAVAYRDGVGNIRGRFFPLTTNPTGLGQDLSTGTAPRNPQISLNANNVIVHWAEGFRDFVADFSLNSALTQVVRNTAATSVANDVAATSLFSLNRSVRTWVDDDQGNIFYQLLDGNTPVGGIRTIVDGMGEPLSVVAPEVSTAMYLDGSFVIVFEEQIDANTSFVRHVAFNEDGTQRYVPVRITSPDALNRVPDVSVRGGFVKSFMVAWKSYNSAADPNGKVVIERFLFEDGSVHPTSGSGPRQIHAGFPPGSNLDPPAIATNETGGSVVVWSAKPAVGPSRVFAVPVARDANLNF